MRIVALSVLLSVSSARPALASDTPAELLSKAQLFAEAHQDAEALEVLLELNELSHGPTRDAALLLMAQLYERHDNQPNVDLVLSELEGNQELSLEQQAWVVRARLRWTFYTQEPLTPTRGALEELMEATLTPYRRASKLPPDEQAWLSWATRWAGYRILLFIGDEDSAQAMLTTLEAAATDAAQQALIAGAGARPRGDATRASAGPRLEQLTGRASFMAGAGSSSWSFSSAEKLQLEAHHAYGLLGLNFTGELRLSWPLTAYTQVGVLLWVNPSLETESGLRPQPTGTLGLAWRSEEWSVGGGVGAIVRNAPSIKRGAEPLKDGDLKLPTPYPRVDASHDGERWLGQLFVGAVIPLRDDQAAGALAGGELLRWVPLSGNELGVGVSGQLAWTRHPALGCAGTSAGCEERLELLDAWLGLTVALRARSPKEDA